MNLLKNNNRDEFWHKDEDDLIQEFINSNYYQDKTRDEKLRLMLFIAGDEPGGLQSTFFGWDFNRLWDYYTLNKYRFANV